MQNPLDFKIMSYDGLCEALHAKYPLYLGVRKNEYYEIRSTMYCGEAPFVYMPPETLRINELLRKDIVKHRDDWICMGKDLRGKMLDQVLPQILNY